MYCGLFNLLLCEFEQLQFSTMDDPPSANDPICLRGAYPKLFAAPSAAGFLTCLLREFEQLQFSTMDDPPSANDP